MVSCGDCAACAWVLFKTGLICWRVDFGFGYCLSFGLAANGVL